MKKVAILISLALMLVGILGFLYVKEIRIPQDVVHLHAGFHVYVDGVLQDFTDVKYMHLEPCTLKGSKDSGNDQEMKAHLHDGIGDVVHVHRKNAVWKDLFVNMKYPIDDKNITASYINGNAKPNILNQPIHAYDSLVLLIGKSGDVSTYLKDAVSKEKIMEVEKKSENCGGTS